MECHGQRLDDIACDKTFLADSLCCDVARQAVKVHTQQAGHALCISTGQESRDDPCQHIARTGSGHSTVACGIEKHVAVGTAQRTVVTLQKNIDLKAGSQFYSLIEAIVVAVGDTAGKTVELSRMGR